jgi:AcrR family transcriptional regulator
MARWQPEGRERLEKAAMELYRERGYDQTTVAEIAARAGLTERTFFRHFTDKREVLFSGSARLKALLVTQVAGAPRKASPLEIVTAALVATSPLFDERRDFARHRQALIASYPELRERELIKLASLASAMAEALRSRGVSEPRASLAAEAGMAVFRIAFERWVSDGKRRKLELHLRAAVEQLQAVARARPSR